nr:MAG TPA: hypothetical protein [Caudoviricetes sp.]
MLFTRISAVRRFWPFLSVYCRNCSLPVTMAIWPLRKYLAAFSPAAPKAVQSRKSTSFSPVCWFLKSRSTAKVKLVAALPELVLRSSGSRTMRPAMVMVLSILRYLLRNHLAGGLVNVDVLSHVRDICHVGGNIRLCGAVLSHTAHKVGFQRGVFQHLFQNGFLCHLVKIGLPRAIPEALRELSRVLGNFLDAHNLKSVAAVLGLEHSVVGNGLATVALGGDVPQLRVKAKGILKLVVFVYGVRLNDGNLTGTVGQINKPLIAKLELALHLAVIAEGNQVSLPKRGIRLQAQLCGGHHSAKERLGGAFLELRVGAQCRQGNAAEPLRGHHAGQCRLNGGLHNLNVVLNAAGFLAFCYRLCGSGGVLNHVCHFLFFLLDNFHFFLLVAHVRRVADGLHEVKLPRPADAAPCVHDFFSVEKDREPYLFGVYVQFYGVSDGFTARNGFRLHFLRGGNCLLFQQVTFRYAEEHTQPAERIFRNLPFIDCVAEIAGAAPDFLGENCQRLSGIIHGFSCGGSVDFYHICFSHYCSSFLNRKVLLSEDLK